MPLVKHRVKSLTFQFYSIFGTHYFSQLTNNEPKRLGSFCGSRFESEFNSIKFPVLDIWDSIHDLLGFRRPGSVLHLLGSGRLHCTATAVLWSLCSKMLCFLLQLGCAFTFRLSRALIRDSDSATWCQDSTSLYDPFNSWASTATKAAP